MKRFNEVVRINSVNWNGVSAQNMMWIYKTGWFDRHNRISKYLVNSGLSGTISFADWLFDFIEISTCSAIRTTHVYGWNKRGRMLK